MKQMMKKEEDYVNQSWSEKVDCTQLVSVLDRQFEKQEMKLVHVNQENELMTEDNNYELTAAVEKQEWKIDLVVDDSQDCNDDQC